MVELRDVIGPALSRLPARVDSLAVHRCIIKRPEQARQRLSGLTTNLPVTGVRQMADRNCTRAPDARSSNGTPLFHNQCPDCHCVRLSDARKLGAPCMSCANKRRSTHGMSNTALYRVWAGMVGRCTYPGATHFEYYGGRGIRVCDEWKTPGNFLTWANENGYQKGLELDRIDVNGPYAPENCRFISHAANSRQRRHVRCTDEKAREIRALLTDGHRIREVANKTSVSYMIVWHISKGRSWKTP